MCCTHATPSSSAGFYSTSSRHDDPNPNPMNTRPPTRTPHSMPRMPHHPRPTTLAVQPHPHRMPSLHPHSERSRLPIRSLPRGLRMSLGLRSCEERGEGLVSRFVGWIGDVVRHGRLRLSGFRRLKWWIIGCRGIEWAECGVGGVAGWRWGSVGGEARVAKGGEAEWVGVGVDGGLRQFTCAGQR